MTKKKKEKKVRLPTQKILLIAAGVFVLALILIQGRSRFTKKQAEKESEVQITEVEQVETTELKEVPDSFPKDFPIYPRSEVDSAFVAEGEEVDAQSVVWITNDSFENVIGYYKSSLSSSGWKIDETLDEEDSYLFSFEKESIFGFAGIGETEEGITVISVTVGVRLSAPSM